VSRERSEPRERAVVSGTRAPDRRGRAVRRRPVADGRADQSRTDL